MSQRITQRRGQRGFTLAEILVTTAIFAIIMIAALTVYDRSNRVFKNSTEAADLQQSTRIAFDKLVSDLRMAGFDYNRGGIPSGNGQSPQPDEQIEYAGPAAVVFRANFDYTTNSSRGNGLATDNYSAPVVGGGKVFPYVTTDNTEIVAYVLRSNAPGAANSDSISFYADVEVPRRAYANINGLTSGGHSENAGNAVTISGIDTSNTHPPYTLYRVTYDDVANNRVGTPVAENIRSLQFRYYTDGLGTTLLKNPDGTDITTGRNAGGGTFTADGTGAIGGAGLYDPANVGTTANYDDRTQRSLIQSVRVALIGMNSTPDLSYQNPDETTTAYKNYREYNLSTLIVPRNLGLQGFPEPSYNPPGPPSITGACVGHCGAPFITWTPPSSGGPVITYEVQWDTDPNGAFSAPHTMPINDPSAVSAVVKDSVDLSPSQIIYYRLVAINDNGAGQPSAVYPVTPQNNTKPSPPTAPGSGTFGSNNQSNQITLNWTAPSTNATTVLACNGSASSSAVNIPQQELIGYQVWRGTSQNFDPSIGEGVMVLDYDTPSQPTGIAPGGAVTWVDAAGPNGGQIQSLSPPAACTQYYYRVRAMDRCYKNAAMNVSGNVNSSISDWYPAIGQAAQAGTATSTSTPVTPTGMALDPNSANTQCPVGSTNTCKIGLQWIKTVADTAGNPVAVDTYTLLRERRIQGSNGSFAPDPNNGAAGQRDISGFSSTAGTTAYYQDTGASGPEHHNPGGEPYEYRYSVAAKICSTQSAQFSNTALYPGCNFAVTVAANGASSGDGSSATPFVLGYGDSVTVTRSAGNLLTSLTFTLEINGVPQGTAQTISGGGPYTYSWSHQSVGTIYQLRMDMTDSAGCTMTYIRYVTQQSAANCTFLDLSAAGRPGGPPGFSAGTGSQPRPLTFDFVYTPTQSTNYAITNNQTTEVMHTNVSSGVGSPFHSTVTLVWADVNGLHPELFLSSVDFLRMNAAGTQLGTTLNVAVSTALAHVPTTAAITASQTTIPVTGGTTLGAVGSTGLAYIDSEAVSYTVTSATQLTVVRAANGTTAATHVTASDVEKQMTNTLTVPATLPDIAVGESLRLKLNFTFDSSHKNSSLTTGTQSAIRSLCLSYLVDSDPTSPQQCNLVGKAASTANPASCD
jgi:prepilin-type N-terminal cleavage/methylation domain-containing protein